MLLLHSLYCFQTVITFSTLLQLLWINKIFPLLSFLLISASQWHYFQYLKDILKYRKRAVRMENETLTTTGLAKLTKFFQNSLIQIVKQNIQVKVWDYFVEIWKRYWNVFVTPSWRYEICSKTFIWSRSKILILKKE